MVQVFGARGAHSGAPIATPYLPAAFAGPPTALPASVQLQLCLARLRHFDCFSSISAAASQSAPPAGTPPSQLLAGIRAEGKVGLCRGTALAQAGHASHVTQLLTDPRDPTRVAFTLACGAMGVLRCTTGNVTHTFNPAPLRPRNEGMAGATSNCPRAKATLAWSADGRVLYKLLDQHTVADPVGADGDRRESSGAHSRLCSDRNASDVVADRALESGWLGGELADDESNALPGRKVVYALDVTQTSALRCAHRNACGSHSDQVDNTLPFCLAWQVREPSSVNGNVPSCAHGPRVHVRFEAGATDGGKPVGSDMGLPTPFASGVSLMRTHVPADVACSLGPGRGEDTIWLASLQGVAELPVS